MTSKLAYAAFFVAMWSPARLGAAQDLPSFCASIPLALLRDLADPYSRQKSPDGTEYCEGLLRTPLWVPPPTVISVKQEQPVDIRFTEGARAVLTWCDPLSPAGLIHLQLRALKSPLFALDAQHAHGFEWSSELIARWQPEWKNIAALATRKVDVGGKTTEVVVPTRQGSGYSNSYTFIVHSVTPVLLTTALIKSTAPGSRPEAIPVRAKERAS
jgi:hypothetical protein